ncbi:MAG TPA: hypothetical protein VIX35_09215, partial [Vicinamibacterales bacterium]
MVTRTMPLSGQRIIADAVRPVETRVFRSVLAAGVAIGMAAVVHYSRAGLLLSHYDARAHLTVARRVFDSLTPGWRQLGGVWLPLPHLIDLPLVASNWGYRTGLPVVAASVLTLALGLAALARWIVRETGSVAAALVAPAVILGNPNVLYLQSTPMTEPLLLGLSCVALLAVDGWIRCPASRRAVWAGPAVAALLLVRYEGWFVGAALGAVAVVVRRRDGAAVAIKLARWPAAAVVSFLALSWASTGRLLVTSGFFVPDNPARDHPLAALADMLRVTIEMTGPLVLVCAVAGAAICVVRARSSPTALLPLCLVAAGCLPFGAFDAGHPLRVRYMVPLAAAAGALAAMAVASVSGSRGRLGALAAVTVVLVTLVMRPPFDPRAPMVVEAQRDVPLQRARQPVTAYLARAYDGTPILASMDALGHYMQETSAIGLPLRAFLHEGNGDLWLDALSSPRRHVGWILIES